MRRTLLAATGWVLAASVGVLVGLLAVSLLGAGITGEQIRTLDSQEVARALADASEHPPVPPGQSSPGPTSPAPAPPTSSEQVTRALNSSGGTVIAQCTGSSVYLVSWTPQQGFESDDVIRGPAAAAFLKFESEDLDVLLIIDCRDGIPALVAHEIDD